MMIIWRFGRQQQLQWRGDGIKCFSWTYQKSSYNSQFATQIERDNYELVVRRCNCTVFTGIRTHKQQPMWASEYMVLLPN